VVEKKSGNGILRAKCMQLSRWLYLFPYKDFATSFLYPQKGKVKYLKFRPMRLKKWAFEENVKFIVEGCMHVVDEGKKLFLYHVCRKGMCR